MKTCKRSFNGIKAFCHNSFIANEMNLIQIQWQIINQIQIQIMTSQTSTHDVVVYVQWLSVNLLWLTSLTRLLFRDLGALVTEPKNGLKKQTKQNRSIYVELFTLLECVALTRSLHENSYLCTLSYKKGFLFGIWNILHTFVLWFMQFLSNNQLCCYAHRYVCLSPWCHLEIHLSFTSCFSQGGWLRWYHFVILCFENCL